MNPPRTHPLSSALILFLFVWIKSWFIIAGRTRKSVVLHCAHEDAQFGSDKYISEKEVKSVICMPIILNNVLKVSLLTLSSPLPSPPPTFLSHLILIFSQGIMYLENNLCEGMYKQNRVDLLTVLTSQVCYPCFSFIYVYIFTHSSALIILWYIYIYIY